MARTLNLLMLSGVSLAALLGAASATAQTVGGDDGVPTTPDLIGPAASPDEASDGDAHSERRGRRESRGPEHARVEVSPYIEIGQVAQIEFGNGGDVLTYSSVAVGVEGSVATRRAQAAADVRYERRIGWGDRLSDQDIISGVARGRYDVASGFALEAGALATRASTDGRAGRFGQFAGDQANTANLYSIYAGPTFGRRIGDFDVGAAYRFGYSRADIESATLLPTGAQSLGSFSDSTNHALIMSIGMRPGTLPVGWRVSGGWEREDAGELDQRYDGRHIRLDVTVPVTPTVALVGGVGYERIRLSARPPLLDVNGLPVTDNDGRLVADGTQPRQIAFDTDGLIYDAGVLWRPNRRMSLEARVGRRYGSTTYTGSWSYQQNDETAWALGVYDSVSTTGRQLNNSLATLPTDFDIFRDPIGGGIDGCAFGAAGGSCFTPATSNLSGFGFRNRGAVLSVSTRDRLWSWGAAVGYDRRRYLAGQGAGLGVIDGTVDELWYATLTASRPIDQRTNFTGGIYWTMYDSGFGNFDSTTAGANAAVSRSFNRWLSGTAAFGINAVEQDGQDTRVFGSALFGLRAGF